MSKSTDNVSATRENTNNIANTDRPTEMKSSFPFMKLPPELRNDIYERVFNAALIEANNAIDPNNRARRIPYDALPISDLTAIFKAEFNFRKNIMSLLKTNRKIRQESLMAYTTFTSGLVQILSYLRRLRTADDIRSLTLWYETHLDWAEFSKLHGNSPFAFIAFKIKFVNCGATMQIYVAAKGMLIFLCFLLKEMSVQMSLEGLKQTKKEGTPAETTDS